MWHCDRRYVDVIEPFICLCTVDETSFVQCDGMILHSNTHITRHIRNAQGDKTGILAHQYLDDDELEYALTVEQKWEADWLSAENAKLRCVIVHNCDGDYSVVQDTILSTHIAGAKRLICSSARSSWRSCWKRTSSPCAGLHHLRKRPRVRLHRL